MSRRVSVPWRGLLFFLLMGIAAPRVWAFVRQFIEFPGYFESKVVVQDREETVSRYRLHIDIPKDYGKIVANIQDNGWPVLWLMDDKGRIRNVEVHQDFHTRSIVIDRASRAFVREPLTDLPE